MKKRILFYVFLLVLGAWAEDVPVQVADSSKADSGASAAEVSAVAVDSSRIVADTASVAAADTTKAVAADTTKTVAAADTTSKSSGGLLDALYPIDKSEAIAKGRAFGGVTLSLIQAQTDDDAMNVIIGDVYDAEGYMFTVEAFGGYFLKDALAIGIRGGYSRTWLDIDFALLEDLLDVAEHRKYESNGFFVQPFLKNYLKVFDSRILYFFNETSLMVEYSYGISQTDDGEDMAKTRNKMWTINFGLNPGLCIMVLDRFAFETSVGLLGLSSSIIEVEENGEKHSETVFNMVNFTINLLALDFSLVYFF